MPTAVDSPFPVGPLSTRVDVGLKICREPSRLSRLWPGQSSPGSTFTHLHEDAQDHSRCTCN